MFKIKDKIIRISNHIVNENTPSFSGIVTGECKGNLWVNRTLSPMLVLAESNAVGSFAFLGVLNDENEINELRLYLETVLFPQLKEDGYNAFEFSIDSENLREPLLYMFKDYILFQEKEFSFRPTFKNIERSTVPDSYMLRRIDKILWNEINRGLIDDSNMISTRLLGSWNSFDEFFRKSVGFCVLYENSVVAVIMGTARYKNTVPIDIETREEHRKKNLAYSLSTEFISYCLDHDLCPQWDCVESNTASENLARKMNLDKFRENIVYWFMI